jgi:TDG/mug DNA glycosylase family protein
MADDVWKPTKAQILEAAGKIVPDIIKLGLQVLFCGINPSLYTAAVGHHFARPGNRFWPTLYRSGFTPRILSPFEENLLPSMGLGITNVVQRATATAAELGKDELLEGGKLLREKILHFQPYVLAVLGVGAYKCAFNMLNVQTGLQRGKIGETFVWVLPNPSGLNANYQLDSLTVLYRELFLFVKNGFEI